MSENVIHAVSGATAGMAAMVSPLIIVFAGVDALGRDVSFNYIEYAGSSRFEGRTPQYLCGAKENP